MSLDLSILPEEIRVDGGQGFFLSNSSHSHPSTRHFPHGACSFSEWPQVHISWPPQLCPSSLTCVSACSSQNRMSISRYRVVAVARCSRACCALARALVELTEGVAVGDERAHPSEVSGQAAGRVPRPCWARASSVTGTAISFGTKPEPRRLVHTLVNSAPNRRICAE
jgi:hypothetical protein